MDNVTPRPAPSPESPPRAAPDMRAVFDGQFDYVWNTLRRLGVRPADLEDLSHEVFLRVHARLADYDSSRPIRPWLFGFAYRVAADHRRLARHRFEVFGGPVDAAVDPVRPADERIEADEECALIEAGLANMDVDRRAILLLHDVEEQPVPAIAQNLGIPLNTAYSRLRIAREELAAAVTRLRRRRPTQATRGTTATATQTGSESPPPAAWRYTPRPSKPLPKPGSGTA
jgi:RNA polymerase sigma-70 factor, ECF subfamily